MVFRYSPVVPAARASTGLDPSCTPVSWPLLGKKCPDVTLSWNDWLAKTLCVRGATMKSWINSPRHGESTLLRKHFELDTANGYLGILESKSSLLMSEAICQIREASSCRTFLKWSPCSGRCLDIIVGILVSDTQRRCHIRYKRLRTLCLGHVSLQCTCESR